MGFRGGYSSIKYTYLLHGPLNNCYRSIPTAMAIKEELKEQVKEEGGGKDELEALDALEKEAAEYNKVCV